jgi:hypothetical protein
VFLGYSNLHKGYKCLNVASGRVYISWDVVFDETIFPFSKLNPNSGAQLKSDVMLLHPTLVPFMSSENVIDNHINDSHTPTEDLVEITSVEVESAVDVGSACLPTPPHPRTRFLSPKILVMTLFVFGQSQENHKTFVRPQHRRSEKGYGCGISSHEKIKLGI